MAKEIDCIYCRRRKKGTREHILPKSLGGNLTIFDVCGDCNSEELSRIDYAIVQKSSVSLTRAVDTKVDAFAAKMAHLQVTYYEPLDLWVEVSIENEFETRMLPQLHVRDNGRTNILMKDEKARRDFHAVVSKRLDDGSFDSMLVKIGPVEYATTPRMVQHRSNDVFVRARSENDAKAFLAKISAAWDQIEKILLEDDSTQKRIDKPGIEVSMAIRVDDVQRGVAKIAFNYLDYRLGSSACIQPAFDLIREYVLGSVIHDASVPAGELAVDKRFVHALEFGAPPVETDKHLIGLFYDQPQLVGLVTLYGRHSWFVLLGEVVADFAGPFAHEIAVDRSMSKDLQLADLVRRWRGLRLPTTESRDKSP